MPPFKEEGHKIIVSPELRLIPEFKKIYVRDKSRHKPKALADFAYIYYLYDYRSPYIKYPFDERERKVKELTNREPKWKADEALKQAISKYLELQETPNVKTLKSAINVLITSSTVLDTMDSEIKRLMKTHGKKDDEDVVINNMREIVQLSREVLKLTDELPKALSSIEKLEQKVKEEQTGTTRQRGDSEKGLFED